MALYKDVSSLEVIGYTEPENGTFSDGVQFVLEKLDAIPEADVEHVSHGHWIVHERAGLLFGFVIPNFECSECHTWVRPDGRGKRCLECGAKMDGKET